MNPSTGHLVSNMGPGGWQVEYESIPTGYAEAAQMKLAGERVNGFSEALVSLTSGGKLSRWAAEKRNERKAKSRMAKESRRKNRGR